MIPGELLVPALLVFLDHLHFVDRAARTELTEGASNASLLDFMVQEWGGVIGDTPRETEEERQIEAAIIPLADAVMQHPALQALGAR